MLWLTNRPRSKRKEKSSWNEKLPKSKRRKIITTKRTNSRRSNRMVETHRAHQPSHHISPNNLKNSSSNSNPSTNSSKVSSNPINNPNSSNFSKCSNRRPNSKWCRCPNNSSPTTLWDKLWPYRVCRREAEKTVLKNKTWLSSRLLRQPNNSLLSNSRISNSLNKCRHSLQSNKCSNNRFGHKPTKEAASQAIKPWKMRLRSQPSRLLRSPSKR